MVTPGDAAHTSATHIARKTQRHPACDLYLPGHLVHNIAAKKSWESSDPVRWGRFQGVEDGCLIVRYLDGEGRYRIHRPTEVGRVAQVGDKVRVSERWRRPARNGSTRFSLSYFTLGIVSHGSGLSSATSPMSGE